MRCGATTPSRSPTRSRFSSQTCGESWRPVASLVSFTRSAARATSSAYKRLPIRWRLAGGSALLTLVILLGFAVIVGVLTTRRLQSDFNRQVADAANDLQQTVEPRVVVDENGDTKGFILTRESPNLDTYAAAQNAVIRVVFADGTPIKT